MATNAQPGAVDLRDVTADNVRPVMDLAVAPEQRDYVADNARSIAEHAYTTEAWLRAVYADDAPVGLVLLSERRSVPRYYLWRFMIDQNHQRRGYGAAAMSLLVDYVRTLPHASQLFLSYVPGPHGPFEFYSGLGFVETGREEGGEREMVLGL